MENREERQPSSHACSADLGTAFSLSVVAFTLPAGRGSFAHKIYGMSLFYCYIECKSPPLAQEALDVVEAHARRAGGALCGADEVLLERLEPADGLGALLLGPLVFF